MIKVKENCFYNQKTFEFNEAKEELLIFNRLIVNEQLINYLEAITIDEETEESTFVLFNPKNNLKLKFCCASYFKFRYLNLFNAKSYKTIALINEDGMGKLGVEAHEALFYFFKEMFLNNKECN